MVVGGRTVSKRLFGPPATSEKAAALATPADSDCERGVGSIIDSLTARAIGYVGRDY